MADKHMKKILSFISYYFCFLIHIKTFVRKLEFVNINSFHP